MIELFMGVVAVDFFNTTNLLYGSISEFCTSSECKAMTAGPEFEYLWVDPPRVKKPVKCSAPEYVDNVMSWIEQKVNDSSVFPSNTTEPFPPKFKDDVKTIFKRLFRIYAHMYKHHFDQVQKLGEEAHLSLSMYFIFLHFFSSFF